MDNLTAGNPRAHRIRVHFNTASTLISEGMPVCYSFDSTANWWGGSVSNGEVTAATTVTEGALNPIRYIRVEKPDADNVHAFAGVVAKGGWCGKTTSATANVGQLLDIYVPNGAVVPVLADQACVMGRTILAVATTELYLTAPHGTAGRPVAIAWETNAALSGSAGLILAKLDENLFIHQQGDADSLLVDDLDTAWQRVNTIQIETAGSQWIEPVYIGLDLLAAATATGVALTVDINTYQTACVGNSTALAGQVYFQSGFVSTGGGFRALGAKIKDEATVDLSGMSIACLYLEHYIRAASTGPAKSSMIQCNATIGANAPDFLFYGQNNASLAYTSDNHTAGSKIGSIAVATATMTGWVRIYDDYK